MPEAQLPIETTPKGPDLPTGCCQHAEVSGGSHRPHHLAFNTFIQYTSYFTSLSELVIVMSMLTNDGDEQPIMVRLTISRLLTISTCASAGCVSVSVGVRVSVGCVGASADVGHVRLLKPAGICSKGK